MPDNPSIFCYAYASPCLPIPTLAHERAYLLAIGTFEIFTGWELLLGGVFTGLALVCRRTLRPAPQRLAGTLL